MKWRTDKPTAKLIVAYIRKFNTEIGRNLIDDFPEVLMRIGGQYYYHDLRIAVTEHIEKWADLEEDETVTNCYQLEEAAEGMVTNLTIVDGVQDRCYIQIAMPRRMLNKLGMIGYGYGLCLTKSGKNR